MANLKKTSLRVNPNEDSEVSEAHSGNPENTKQTRGNVGARFRRTQTPPVRTNEVHFRKFPRNSNGQQPTQQVEHNSRALVERIHATQTEFDVIVPPFDGWDEKNPMPGENYTEIFGKVVHARRNFESPYKLSQPRVQMETEAKGRGCFSWIC
ncbi:uncharacterized protein LOC121970200 isoform X1 [Zingiber officinale]|uniref:uncharacterized protein LOC121970200 isoform X1 n=1 Tax=Zingiber officinale TaxID=94328 RepID=UPI001C4D2164|nr:uncharacterized protein LOC121970200 isoform X1 [Zingiber officinale]